jgi:hypothetical protein
MKLLATVLALAASVIPAACGDDAIHDPPPWPRVPGPANTIVVYERTGGIAGIRERLAVRPDGAARLETGYPSGPGYKVKRFELSPVELDDLRSARDAVEFAELDDEYAPDQPVADGFATAITAEGREVTVLTEGDPPAELEHLIEVCARLV